jgi:succinate dehydrogenase/fumarate reductase flavoprotein subunit
MSWNEFADDGVLYEWPYPVRYGVESEVTTDVLILGGGIAGCWAAISAAKKGARVVLVEKGATIRSGSGGSGCDHWQNAIGNPCCKVTAEERSEMIRDTSGGYGNIISDYITSRENYATLLELEEMGGKIRDTEDEFRDAPFRDEKTKFLFAYDYENRSTIRVWGTTFKPALYNECKRLGVEIYDRVMATCLLNEGGVQGARVIGATGLHARTGEFIIFKSKATVNCLARHQRNFALSTELRGVSTFSPPQCTGDGHALGWRAGAAFIMMEKTVPSATVGGYGFPPYSTGSTANTWFPCTIVDARGKKVPWVDRDGNILEGVSERTRPSPGQKFSVPFHRAAYDIRGPNLTPHLTELIKKGEFMLPLYADLSSMPEHERKVIWGMMIGEEAKTKIPILNTYEQAGFDPNKDLLQSYTMLRGDMFGFPNPYERDVTTTPGGGGGPVIDWDLRTSLEGLYVAGDTLFGGVGHGHAATTGRYAGRKAAQYALKAVDPVVTRQQVEHEKSRVYSPIKNRHGVDWKELNFSAQGY